MKKKLWRGMSIGFALLVPLLAVCSSKQSGKPSDPGDSATSSSKAPNSGSDPSGENPGGGTYDITVQYTTGEHISPAIIYAVWLENESGDFIVPIYVCQHLLDNSLTGTALPYWYMNKRPKTDAAQIDAVTGATVKKADFSVAYTLKSAPKGRVTLFVEMDHSFDKNDWFRDQPAVLWAGDLSLTDSTTSVTLKPIGWTANEITEGQVPGAVSGTLQTEMKYITHLKDGSGFGESDPRAAVHMTSGITAKVTPK